MVTEAWPDRGRGRLAATLAVTVAGSVVVVVWPVITTGGVLGTLAPAAELAPAPGSQLGGAGLGSPAPGGPWNCSTAATVVGEPPPNTDTFPAATAPAVS